MLSPYRMYLAERGRYVPDNLSIFERSLHNGSEFMQALGSAVTASAVLSSNYSLAIASFTAVTASATISRRFYEVSAGRECSPSDEGGIPTETVV